MIEFNCNENTGKLICKQVGKLANTFRRIFLDEIETYAFKVSEAIMQTQDPLLSHNIFTNISLIRFKDPFATPEDNDYYLKVQNLTNAPADIFSTHICSTKTKKPIENVEKFKICDLSPGCDLAVTNIGIEKGIGRQHVKYSAVFGPIKYKPTDICFVHYLADNGKIMADMVAVPYIGVFKESYKKHKLITDLLVWNEDWATNLSKEDLLLSSKLRKVSYTGHFCPTQLYESEDFKVTFRAHKPKKTMQQAVEVIRKELNIVKNCKDKTIETTISIGELLRDFTFKELEVPIYGNFAGKNYKLRVEHVDHDKLVLAAIAKIEKILDNIKYN